MNRWRGKWALVTGASAGIGRAMAEQLAAGGAKLVLTARRRDRLAQLASDLGAKFAAETRIVVADLARPDAPHEIYSATSRQGITIELLVNNAGFGAYGPFHESDLARQLEMIQVNCSAVVHLTRLYLLEMVERRHGDILIVASTAAFQAVPYITTYAATKAFDLLFAEGLAEEVRRFGVTVCALCPGSTATEFREVAGQPERTFRHVETPEKVARVALEGLIAEKSCVVSGWANRFGVEGLRLAPRRFVTRVAARIFAPRK